MATQLIASNGDTPLPPIEVQNFERVTETGRIEKYKRYHVRLPNVDGTPIDHYAESLAVLEGLMRLHMHNVQGERA